MLKSILVAFMLTTVSLGTARAASIEEVQALYTEGQYDAAADMGESLNTPEGLTLATKALLGKTNLLPRKERSLDDIARANALAEAAFEMDPDNIDAHLQYATSLGIRGRLISKFRAKLERLPERAEEHLAIARKLQPDHAWANAFYAAWHLEVTRNGGATLARAMYGATREQGIEIYDRALTLQPMSRFCLMSTPSFCSRQTISPTRKRQPDCFKWPATHRRRTTRKGRSMPASRRFRQGLKPMIPNWSSA